MPKQRSELYLHLEETNIHLDQPLQEASEILQGELPVHPTPYDPVFKARRPSGANLQ